MADGAFNRAAATAGGIKVAGMAKRRSFYRYYHDFEPTRPIATHEGIKARSQRGGFAKNWWASQWIEALEQLVDSGRLSRGRSYARRGQVLSIQETKNGIEARVQGSRPKPYKVTIEMKPLSDAQWDLVIERLAEQAIFAAQLLAGEMPGEIEDAFQEAGVSLFPAHRNDLETDCSCPDWANPCKHVAAAHYLLAERFDEDPFLLFRLRGRNQDQIFQALRQLRAGEEAGPDEAEEEPEPSIPLEQTLEHFWDSGQELESFSVSIKPPAVEMPLLKRLGEPSFAPAPGLQSHLAQAYLSISEAALAAAYQEKGEEED